MTISIGMTALQRTVLGCLKFESRTRAAAGEFSLALADPLWVPAGEKGHRHCRDIEPASIQLDHALESRGFNPRRAALRAADQPARTRAGRRSTPLRHHAGDDGGVIAIDLLQQAAAAHRKIVMNFWRMQMQSVVVDDIDIALVAGRDHAAIVQP